MAMLHEDQLPIAFEADFLTMLDIDLGDEENKSWPVEYYDHAWWNGRKPRDLDSSKILDALSIDKCLETQETAFVVKKGRIHWLPVLSSLPTMPTFNIGMALSPNRIKANDIECWQCSQLSHILSNSLNDLLDAHCFSNVMKTSSKAQWNMDMCQASTFHVLHEVAVIKEMASPSSASASSLGQGSISSVTEKAKIELDRLCSLPSTLYKWTWGEKLTEGQCSLSWPVCISTTAYISFWL